MKSRPEFINLGYMRPLGILALIIITVLANAISGYGTESIIVLKFDCQGETKYLTNILADSLIANLKIIQVPVVSRGVLERAIDREGCSENDLNYNPSRLSRLVAVTNAQGAVYGQVYQRNGLIIMDTYYIEADYEKPVDIDPMVGFSGDDILEMTWDLAVILSQPDKTRPKVTSVSPADNTVISDDRTEITVCFDEPMNPDCYCLKGEPEDMFFTYGEVKYDSKTNCFKFNVHLYSDMKYKFWVNGPGLKPFKDTSGNVAASYRWNLETK